MKNLDVYLNGYLQDNRELIINDLMELVRVPSVIGEPQPGAPFGEQTRKALDTVSAQMMRMGQKVIIPEHGAYGYCEFGSGEKIIGLIPHLDVVPPSGKWMYDPFEPVFQDGYMISRGVSDDKGGAIGSMYALDAIAKAGILLKNKNRLIFLCNEEVDMEGDIDHLEQAGLTPDFSLVPDAFFPIGNGEKGYLYVKLSNSLELKNIKYFCGGMLDEASVPINAECVLKATDALEAELDVLCNTNEALRFERNNGEIKVSAIGVGAHPVMPESGVNAVWVLANALQKVNILSEPDHMAMELIATLTEGYTGEGMGVAYHDVESGDLTCVCMWCEIADGKIDLRFSIKYCVTMAKQALLNMLKDTAEKYAFVLSVEKSREAHYISPNDKRVQSLMTSYFKSCGQKPELYVHPGNTYAGILKNAVIFGNEFRAPGPFGMQRGRAHQQDEVTNIDLLVQSVRVYVYAILALDEII